ncbi:penicillin-binding protein [Micrococcales bacterium 31B]|nr:penicillin-binding protein [Micrococcales bacterium 31B]
MIDYPRRGKRGVRRWLPSFRLLLGLAFGAALVVVAILVLAYALIPVPRPNDFAISQSTTVYYSDGKTEIGRFSEVNREVIAAEEIPLDMKQAIVASEDSAFYSNSGVDPKGIARALVNNARGNAQQGASTITMQYIENYYRGTDKTYLGKVREALLAYKIERQFNKDTILSSYLNTIYFGRGAYGIQRAAQAYYGKDATELTASECALLAGIVPAPSAYDPALSPGIARERWERVLDRMVLSGGLTPAEREQQVMPETISYRLEQAYQGPNGYLMAMVHDELRTTVGISEDEIERGGLRVVTTLNADAQAATFRAVKGLVGRPEGTQVGVASVDPTSGAVLAVYGGDDYLKTPNNNATQAIVQGGALFKPFALAAAVESGTRLDQPLTDLASDAPRDPLAAGVQQVRRIDPNTGVATVSVLAATAFALDSPYTQLNAEVGGTRTRAAALAAGIPTDTFGLDDSDLNVLGTAAPRPLEIATAYATFASGGQRHTPYIVASVTSPGGKRYLAQPVADTVFTSDVASSVNYALSAAVTDGVARPAAALGRPAAAMSATNGTTSLWFAGYTPQISTAVAIFATDAEGRPAALKPFGRYDTLAGSGQPADVWLTVQAAYLRGEPTQAFVRPPERLISGAAPAA